MFWNTKEGKIFLKIIENLKVSKSCIKDIIVLVEGDIVDFQIKRKEKVLDKNAHKMADIIRSGKVRVTKGGTLIGDPRALNKVREIEKENEEVGLGRGKRVV